MKKLNKILCIDFGTKIIGFAITDNERKFALPFCEIPNNQNKFNKILEFIESENIGLIIVGYPKTRNNYVSERHQIINNFKNELDEVITNKNLDVKAIFYDESYSTKSSFDSLKNFNVKTNKLSKNKDMIAASIVLENYLNKFNS